MSGLSRAYYNLRFSPRIQIIHGCGDVPNEPEITAGMDGEILDVSDFMLSEHEMSSDEDVDYNFREAMIEWPEENEFDI